MVILKTDGLSKGNPGKAAFAFLIVNMEGVVLTGGGGRLGVQTNNYAEYMGLVAGLKECLHEEMLYVMVETDSKLIVGHLMEGWEVKSANLKPLFAKVRQLSKEFESKGALSIKWVPRSLNEEADFLANEILFKGIDTVRRERNWRIPTNE